MKTYLITGGAGFVGSNLAIEFKALHSPHHISPHTELNLGNMFRFTYQDLNNFIIILHA